MSSGTTAIDKKVGRINNFEKMLAILKSAVMMCL
jgi:hypothetical protein